MHPVSTNVLAPFSVALVALLPLLDYGSWCALPAVGPEAGCGLLSLWLAPPVFLDVVARAAAVEHGGVGAHGCGKESACDGSDGVVQLLMESCGRCLLLSGLREWC